METTQPTTRRETSRRVAINRGIAKGFALGFAVALVMACLFWAFGTPATPAHAEPKAASHPTITALPVPTITDAPVVPQCTDAIAEAGGICQGEPVARLDVIPAPAPGPETTPETWVSGTEETQVFSDGSWLAADGTQGCNPDGACAQVPPAPADARKTPNGGYYPELRLQACATEDSDNCYWDAHAFGNGQGTDFLRVGGVTYYPEYAGS